jgi:RNA 3'-phosphate cyclase
MIEIDGSHGEGGGQILRTSAALSSMLCEPVRIFNIRANRPRPGLRPQHLHGIKAAARLSDAEMKGVTEGSSEVTLKPCKLRACRQQVNVGTAGSVTLVLQSIMLPALAAERESHFKIIGGTDVKWSPPVDYCHFILFSILKLMGAEVSFGLVNRGYYPKGGGEIEVKVEPLGERDLRPLVLEEQIGEPSIFGNIHSSKLPEHVSKRIKEAATKELVGFKRVRIMDRVWKARDPGCGMTLVAEFRNCLLGSSMLGEKGVRSEDIGKTVAREIMRDGKLGATMDVHLADQILPFLAIADGKSCFTVREISKHAETNMWVIEQFLSTKFSIRDQGDLKRVEVEPVR